MISVNSSFDISTVTMVWSKGIVIPNSDPRVWRLDAYGAVIRRDQYGQRNKAFGWEVDHIRPVAGGGSDALSNLRPLYYKNNLRNAEWPPRTFHKYDQSSQANDKEYVSFLK